MATEFSIVIGRHVIGDQYKVIVKGPLETDRQIRRPNQLPNRKYLQSLLLKLTADKIEKDPNPTQTLVSDGSHRIDTQPATEVWRNIAYQYEKSTYATITIERGAEICYAAGYQKKLRNMTTKGLDFSFPKGYIYTIEVRIAFRKKTRNEWQNLIGNAFKESIPIIIEMIRGWKRTGIEENTIGLRLDLAKIIHMIAHETNEIEHVTEAVTKLAERLTLEEGEHAVAKKIPIISTIMGVFFGVQRAVVGDWKGAFAEVASGMFADMPGIGTVISGAIDAGLFTRDIEAALANQSSHKRLLEDDIRRLRAQKEQHRRELAELVPESPIYGAGCEQPFDESDLANVDDITEIRVWSGDLIDGIQVIYRFDKGARHGGEGGQLRTLELEKDERIIQVSGTMRSGIIYSLTFYTDCGRSETFGTQTSEMEEFNFEMTDGSYLAAIKGFDRYRGNKENYPEWAGNFELLPAIGFIAKF